MMIGRSLKMTLAELARVHNVRHIERPPLPLLAPTTGPQIIEGYASTPDLDSDRMVFTRGALSWPSDLTKLPLVIRHDLNRRAGRILDLRYDSDGRLFIKALVDDPDARRMGGFSVSASVSQSTVHNPDGCLFYATLETAVIDEISLTPIPANPHALVTLRRDVAPIDDQTSHDAVVAALERFKTGLEIFVKSKPGISSPPVQAPPEQQSPALTEIGPAPAFIYGTLPSAVLKRKRSQFTDLVARLPVGESRC